MELLCNTCQRKLVIPDESAGQPVKCPQCGNIFTAPTLPGMPAPFELPSAPAMPAPAPVVSPAPAHPAPVSAGGDGAAAAPFSAAHAAAPPDIPPHFDASAPAPQAAAPEAYRHKWTLWISPRFLQGAAVAAALGVFVLSFFPWVGRYPGGVEFETQTAWQAGFGGHTLDKTLEGKFPAPALPEGKKEEGPGGNGLLLFFLLLLVPLLLLTVASVVLAGLPGKLPPVVERLKPWRWGIVTGIALLAFVFLVMQLVTGFSMEARLHTAVDKQFEVQQKAAMTPTEVKLVTLERGRELDLLHRTAALTWTFWLLLLLVVCAALVFRFERRPNRPMPRIEASW